MPSRILFLAALLCLTPVLHAQEEEPIRYQIYGGYSYLSNSLNGVPGSHHALNGWDASVAFPAWHDLRFKLEVNGYNGTNLGAQQQPYFITGGGQFGHRFGRETIFGDAMAGEAGANRYWGAQGSTGGTASFVGYVGGGLDSKITHHFAFRVAGGYQYSYFSLIQSLKTLIPYRIAGLPTNFGRLSSGVVWQF